MMLGKRAQNLLLLGFVIVLLLVATELTVRHIYRDVTTTADNRSYFALKWKARHVRLNSLGFRDREPPRHKSVNSYRIAFIGDSFTFGQGIPEASRMSEVLEESLTASKRHVEVLNFGNPGINTADEVRVLRRVLATYSPDFVLLQWYVNDVKDNSALPIDLNLPRPKPSFLVRAKQWLRNKSALYFLAASVWHKLLAAGGRGDSDDLHDLVRNPLSQASIAADQKLKEFIALANAASVPCGIVLVPDTVLVGMPKYEFAYLHERVLKVCQESGIPCLDLAPIFGKLTSEQAAAGILWVNEFDAHMGIKANAVAAAEINEFFSAYWPPANRTEVVKR